METITTTPELLAATIRKVVREELKHLRTSGNLLTDTWINEKVALELCGKSRTTLLRAIESGLINQKDIRPNPLGKGFLIRRTALVKD